MRRVKADVAIIGDGGAAMLAANRLASQNLAVALINPADEFGIGDLRPASGLGLWSAAYRAQEETSLAELYDLLSERLREVFPAPMEQSGLARGEHWSVLSSTPAHRSVTEELEREFFKVERKAWSAGQFRLVNPEHVLAIAKRIGLDLSAAAQVEGGVIRTYGIWWDAARMGYYLQQHARAKAAGNPNFRVFVGSSVEGRYGRRLVLSTREREEVSVEAERAVLIFLTGDLLPHIRSIAASCAEPWIQGVRKRRREQHFVWFERPGSDDAEAIWLELGRTRYRWFPGGGTGSWQSGKGPDGLERAVREGLGLQRPSGRFIHAERAFRLEWEWRSPQWRETSHETFWATSFEGDLWGILEVLWNTPVH